MASAELPVIFLSDMEVFTSHHVAHAAISRKDKQRPGVIAINDVRSGIQPNWFALSIISLSCLLYLSSSTCHIAMPGCIIFIARCEIKNSLLRNSIAKLFDFVLFSNIDLSCGAPQKKPKLKHTKLSKNVIDIKTPKNGKLLLLRFTTINQTIHAKLLFPLPPLIVYQHRGTTDYDSRAFCAMIEPLWAINHSHFAFSACVNQIYAPHWMFLINQC